jgi:hypothetical protein
MLMSTAVADDLQWDFPADWDAITGYTVRFSDVVTDYNKTVLKDVLYTSDSLVAYVDFEQKLQMDYGVEYTIYIEAYNDAGPSGPSNTVTYTREPYVPPVDSLPAGASSPQSPSGLGSL